VKDCTNPHFKSKYADINSYIDMLRPLLRKHGLIVLQPIVKLDDSSTGVGVKTVLTCETGETFESFAPIPCDDNPQRVGSYITYMRRYCIQSLFFLSADDDDGEAVVRPVGGAPATRTWNKPKQ
jgi:hypothetical protein